jgi:hypothetical protein
MTMHMCICSYSSYALYCYIMLCIYIYTHMCFCSYMQDNRYGKKIIYFIDDRYGYWCDLSNLSTIDHVPWGFFMALLSIYLSYACQRGKVTSIRKASRDASLLHPNLPWFYPLKRKTTAPLSIATGVVCICHCVITNYTPIASLLIMVDLYQIHICC